MALVEQLVADLRAESTSLDHLVADLDEDAWRTPTPAEPWTIADTIGHLLWTDRVSLVAVSRPAAFEELAAEHRADGAGDAVDRGARQAGAAPPATLLADWRTTRDELAEALLTIPPGTSLPWFGPSMSAASMATARLMETWAHGEDVADALGVQRPPTLRLRHVAHIAVRARGHAFRVHDRRPPEGDVRVELDAPDGSTWTWGEPDAADRVTGSAADFCLLAVQRVHRDDTDLRAQGEVADAWLDVVQAFAGPPGSKRAPSGQDQSS